MNLRAVLGSLYAPLLIHNLNEGMAKVRGDGESTTAAPGTVYPGSANTTTINKANWLGPGLLGAALLAAGSGGALLIPGLVGQKPVTPQPVSTAQQPAATAQPALPDTQAFDEVMEVQQPDGSWKEVERHPFGVFPKGKQ